MLTKKNRDSQNPSIAPCDITAPKFASEATSESRGTMMNERLSAIICATGRREARYSLVLMK